MGVWVRGRVAGNPFLLQLSLDLSSPPPTATAHRRTKASTPTDTPAARIYRFWPPISASPQLRYVHILIFPTAAGPQHQALPSD